MISKYLLTREVCLGLDQVCLKQKKIEDILMKIIVNRIFKQKVLQVFPFRVHAFVCHGKFTLAGVDLLLQLATTKYLTS